MGLFLKLSKSYGNGKFYLPLPLPVLLYGVETLILAEKMIKFESLEICCYALVRLIEYITTPSWTEG